MQKLRITQLSAVEVREEKNNVQYVGRASAGRARSEVIENSSLFAICS